MHWKNQPPFQTLLAEFGGGGTFTCQQGHSGRRSDPGPSGAGCRLRECVAVGVCRGCRVSGLLQQLGPGLAAVVARARDVGTLGRGGRLCGPVECVGRLHGGGGGQGQRLGLGSAVGGPAASRALDVDVNNHVCWFSPWGPSRGG